MNTAVLSMPLTPSAGLAAALTAAGVPGSAAASWARVAGVQVPTLHRVEFEGGTAWMWEAHRALASQRTILSWAASDGMGERALPKALELLVDAVLTEARASRALFVKAATSGDDDALGTVLLRRGFTAMPPIGHAFSLDPSEDLHAQTMRGWLRRADGMPLELPDAPAYERQKSDFTCGPACAIMALSRDGAPERGFGAELRMWREATYFGGCDHFGVATLLARRGLPTRILVDVDAPILGTGGPHALNDAATRMRIHREQEAGALELGVGAHIGPVERAGLDEALARGEWVILLVDLERFNGEPAPHWVVVWGRTGSHYLLHDPWSDEEFGETWLETAVLPIEGEDLWSIASWEEEGGEAHRAMILVGRGAQQEAIGA